MYTPADPHLVTVTETPTPSPYPNQYTVQCTCGYRHYTYAETNAWRHAHHHTTTDHTGPVQKG